MFWGIAVTLAFGFLLYNFVKITATFFAFQTSVRLSLQNENQLKFPVITLCNMNPLRRTAMERVGLVAGTAYRTSGERRKRNVRSRRGECESKLLKLHSLIDLIQPVLRFQPTMFLLLLLLPDTVCVHRNGRWFHHSGTGKRATTVLLHVLLSRLRRR